jgi:outer membrane protein OmpA-like peptidoglycan-associated protein
MRRQSIVSFLFIAFLFVFVRPSSVHGDAGYTSANFLKIGMGARAVAMSDSFTALADDATAIYWNPAGLVQVPGTEISLTETQYLQGVNINFIALSQNLGNDGALGLGFTDLSLQPFLSTTENSGGFYNGTGSAVNVSDWNLSIGYSNSLGKFIAGLLDDTLVGAKLNIVGQNEAGPTGTAFSFDAGAIQLFPQEHFSLGFDLQNAGTVIQDRSQPLIFKTGAAWYHLRNLDSTDKLTLSVDADFDNDTGFQPSFGSEYQISLDRVTLGFLRVGLRTTDEQFGLSFLTLGAGLQRDFSDFTAGLDYAFVPYGTLGPTNWFTLTVQLGRENKMIKATIAGPAEFEIDSPSVPLSLKSNSNAPIAEWTVHLTDDKGAPVQTFHGTGEPPSVLNWNGKNEDGVVVKPGTYVALLKVRNIEGLTADTAPVSFRAMPALTMKEFKWTLGSDALFDTAQASLSDEGKRRLVTIEKGLQKYFIESKVDILGFTDNEPCRLGPHCLFKDNFDLSRARAKTVQELFLQLGLRPENITINWFADDLPVASNSTPGGRAMNRRIEVVVQSSRGGETPETMMNAGIFLMNNNLPDQALELFQKVADYEPDQPESYHLMATCLFNMGRLDEAEQAEEKAEKLTAK